MALGLYRARKAARRGWRGLRARVSAEWRGRFGPLPHPRSWVFIVGCYNSGTTLLHELLAQHPEIGSMPDEGQFYQDQLPVPREVGLRRMWAAAPELFRMDEHAGAGVDLDRLKRQWGAMFNDPSRPLLLEKSPPNAARTRWLNAHFDGARFIGIVRDGRAVAEGLRRKVGLDIDAAATQWVVSNEVMLEDFEHLPRTCLVKYEDLSADPDTQITRLLAFLGLPPIGDVGAAREWKIHEQSSRITDMNQRSLAGLSAQDLERIDRVAGDMMIRLGYSG